MKEPRTGLPLAGVPVLVTGLSGFVGGHLHRALTGRGAVVSGLGKEDAPPPSRPVEWFSADLTDERAIADAVALARPGAVVHLAGQASAGRSFRSPEETFRTNVLGVWYLLAAIRAHAPEARVLVVGSGESYGPQPEGTRVAEGVPFRPVSPYALSKAVADTVAASVSEAAGLDIIRTRSFSHAGPGQTPGFALPSWAQQISRIEKVAGPGILSVGNLDVTRDILDVRDVVECYVRLLESGRGGEAYNVCRGEGMRLRDIVTSLARLGRVPIEVRVDPDRFRPADVEYLVGDPSKAAAATGWVPARTIQETLHDLLEWSRGVTGAETS